MNPILRPLILIVIVPILFLGAACSKNESTQNTNQRIVNTSQNSNTVANTNTTVIPSGNVNIPAQTTNTAPMITLTSSEVAKHDSSGDCWLIIDGSVYDVTSYIPRHPGGAEEIVSLCGRDATTAFRKQGGEGQHSTTAVGQLAQLKFGALGATVER